MDELRSGLLDTEGQGGPDVRFEVCGSRDGDAPGALSVIASTGSLSLAGTPDLESYSAPTEFTAR